jgi:ADP-heptose:LPS heptosyltransferase
VAGTETSSSEAGLPRGGLIARAVRFTWWKIYLGLRMPDLANRLARRWGWPARRIRMALPQQPPFRRREIDVLRTGALGDVLLCTPALRALKAANPRSRLRFYTDIPGLVQGLEFIDEVLPSSQAPADKVWLTYESSVPPRRHLARVIGDHLGLDVRDVRPSCVVDPALRDGFREAWRELPRPWVMINRKAGPWTPNKDWPDEHWEALIDRLLAWASVIEIGQATVPERGRDPARYQSLIGKTNLSELVAAVAAADLLVGPISGPTHIAAAAKVPAVIIYGGYEHPVGTDYEGNVNLYSPVPCSPCWLREPCPYSKKCLYQIEPPVVEEALRTLWLRSRDGSRSGDAR